MPAQIPVMVTCSLGYVWSSICLDLSVIQGTLHIDRSSNVSITLPHSMKVGINPNQCHCLQLLRMVEYCSRSVCYLGFGYVWSSICLDLSVIQGILIQTEVLMFQLLCPIHCLQFFRMVEYWSRFVCYLGVLYLKIELLILYISKLLLLHKVITYATCFDY